MTVISETIAAKSETRTPLFYEMLKALGKSSPEIERIKRSIQSFPNDTLTDYFVHDGRNVFGFFIMAFDIELELTLDDFTQARESLLKIRAGLDWFIEPGFLDKGKIEAFLDEAENHKQWNKSVVENLYNNFCALTELPIES